MTTPSPQKTSFLSHFSKLFSSKTGNLRQKIPFSENCVAIWRFFAKKNSLLPGSHCGTSICACSMRSHTFPGFVLEKYVVTRKEGRLVLPPLLHNDSNTQSTFSVHIHIVVLGLAIGRGLPHLNSRADSKSSTPSHTLQIR